MKNAERRTCKAKRRRQHRPGYITPHEQRCRLLRRQNKRHRKPRVTMADVAEAVADIPAVKQQSLLGRIFGRKK
jgi:hypothetical protein